MKKKVLFITIIFLIVINGQTQSYGPELDNPKIKVQPVIPIKTFVFNLRNVRLMGDGPFKNAMDRDAAYIFRLDPKRLLHREKNNLN
jgi:uncharacterized protein